MSLWVVDASPLIFLAKIDRLPVLQGSAERILVPETVLSEIRAGDDLATARIERAAELWLRPVASAPNPSSPQVGELAVIELALEHRAERVVLDDRAARRHARAQGLSVVGTLGLLLAARLRAEIRDLGREIDRLESHGFRASPQLVQRVLSEAGER